ncbi:MAG: SUMF1/EgtB/PvdO family nonheme iron enzyme, partial [Thermodesulfovibrionia bacterium]|nr:SUMF1/EgtB/PvdO family nonheme iron enzyme [Thermodesulfovibrionia bacterium]
MPSNVAAIEDVACEVRINDKGFWEAAFSGGHVLIYIPEGEFIMGSEVGEPDELPSHKVYLDAYWLAKYTVTVGQFKEFIAETGYITDAERGKGSYLTNDDVRGPNPIGNWHTNLFDQADNHPVVSVSWNDAVSYCSWLSNKIGINFVLPTAAQWEKGARGENGWMYPWGNQPPDG